VLHGSLSCSCFAQLVTGQVGQLLPLVPLVISGNIMAEDHMQLTPRHFKQLVRLAQICLEVLWVGSNTASSQLVR
jgi:hypothetical protein